jgi:hypothetical protein
MLKLKRRVRLYGSPLRESQLKVRVSGSMFGTIKLPFRQLNSILFQAECTSVGPSVRHASPELRNGLQEIQARRVKARQTETSAKSAHH